MLLGVGSPGSGNWAVAAAHGDLEILVFDLGGKVGGKLYLHSSVDEVESGEAELEHKVVIKFNHISDGDPDCSQGVLNDVLTHLAGMGDWHRVGVDHAEALGVD